MVKEVDGDTWEGFWDAITGTDPFTVCYDELFNVCYTAPGYGSYTLLFLGIFEITCWTVGLRILYRKVRENRERKRRNELDDKNRPCEGQSGHLDKEC